jgi:Na+/proline symporter
MRATVFLFFIFWLQEGSMIFDLSAYLSAAVGGVPLLFVVLALVWWYGQALHVKGTVQFVASLVTGLVIGVLYMVSATRPPSGGDLYARYVYWFGAGFYGLGLGLLASASHDLGLDLVNKSVAKVLGK